MKAGSSKNAEPEFCRRPHVLIVEKNKVYGNALVSALRRVHICAKHVKTVDQFLDLGCRTRVDAIALEVDVLDPESVHNLQILRTHFGEGPGTRIFAVSSYASDAFPSLLQRKGADLQMTKRRLPEEMAAALEAEIRR